MAVQPPTGQVRTVTALLTLTAVTGLIDAVSYLRLGHVFVANMTGNVVFLGFSAHPGSGLSAVASLVAIGGFLAGAYSGGRLAQTTSARPARWLAMSFAMEAVLLAGVALLTAIGVLPEHAHGSWATIAILAIALGVQNSTVRHLGVADLTTTVLTLSLTGLSADRNWTARPARRRAASVLAMLAGAAAGAGLLQISTSGVIAVAATLTVIAATLISRARLMPSGLMRPGNPAPSQHPRSDAELQPALH
jgi:uncharacterized membrane protein YoaK (UPF0700 family)